MPDWKRIIVGGAFKLPSKHPRYYVDVVLGWPVIIALLAVTEPFYSLPPSTWDGRTVVWGGAGLLACFLLAKEKAVTFGAALAYIFFAGLIMIPLRARTSSEIWTLLGVSLAAGAGAWAIVHFNAGKTGLYKTTTMADWVVTWVVLLGASFFLFRIVADAFHFYFS